MTDDRWARLAPLSGIGFVLLFFGGALMISEWTYLPSGSDLVELFEDSATRVMFGAYLGLVSAAFLAWFSGSVRARLRKAEEAPGRLAAVAFGGGMGAATLIAAGFGSMFAAAARGGDSSLSADAAIALYDLAGVLVGNVAAMLAGVLILATAVVGFRTRIFASWFTWVSALLGVALMSPVAWAVLVAVPLWVAVLSVIMYREQRMLVG